MPANTIKQRIIDDLTVQIRTGQLKPGDKLPTSPQLQAAHGAQSLVPVRAAIAALTVMGLVVHQPGVGIFVAERPAVE
jgi:DNA-binding GntR family transcriptional regulator